MRSLLFITLSTCLFFFTISCSSDSGTTDAENAAATDSSATSNTSDAPEAPESEDAGINVADFMELESDMLLEEYVGQKIWVTGTITKPENMLEHLMKEAQPFGDGEEEKNVCIDFNDGEQTICYYKGITVPEDDQPHKYYGSVDKISRPGKGGDMHTEYFILLEKVD